MWRSKGNEQKLDPFLSPCGSQALNSGSRGGLQVPLHAEPSYQVLDLSIVLVFPQSGHLENQPGFLRSLSLDLETSQADGVYVSVTEPQKDLAGLSLYCQLPNNDMEASD